MTSCGTLQIYVNQDSAYSKKDSIIINQTTDDKSGTLGELQFLLQSNGYNLMSYGAAKNALNLDADSLEGSVRGKITNTTSYNSIYLLDLNYSYYYDVFYYAYTTFSATITDLENGETVMVANFRGDKSCRAVLKELVEKMNKVIE
jgi:ABC-type amino acid transport substrate-binding protein